MPRPNVQTGTTPIESKRPCSLHGCTKEQLLEYFENTFDLDEWLFSSLKDEEYFYKCPDRLRLPLVFYYCHTSVLYIHKLTLAGLITERVNEDFEAMFETGVDEMSWDDTENFRMGGAYQWPSISEIIEYRKKVRKIVCSVIENTELIFPVTEKSPLWAIWLAIEHERIHFETSAVLIRQLPIHMVTKPSGWKYGPLTWGKPIDNNPMIRQKPQTVVLGKSEDCAVYGWDNEYGRQEFCVPAFEASKYKVTNREMLEFVQEEGYANKEYWSNEGWEWRTYREAKHPQFWVCHEGCKSNCGGQLATYTHCGDKVAENGYNLEQNSNVVTYRLRLMFDIVPLPMDWPVVVNFHEAQAFCRWKGKGYRLLSQAEQTIIRDLPVYSNKDITTEPIFNENVTKNYNINMAYGSSTPVNMYPPTRDGFCDVLGNVWDWVEDHFNGFPGFKVNRFYHDYSITQFDGKHNFILGGSWVTTGTEASQFGRYAFRRHFMQLAGFRLARTLDGKKTPVVVVKPPSYNIEQNSQDCHKSVSTHGVEAVYCNTSNLYYAEKSASKLIEQTVQHYSAKNECYSQWDALHARICALAEKTANEINTNQVLLVGCGDGKLAFDLSPSFERVLACDPSTLGIYIAQHLKEKGKFTIESNGILSARIVNGNSQTTVSIPTNAISDRVEFKQLSWLPYEVRGFKLVICTLIDRDPNPHAWLLRIRDLLTGIPGGTAIVVGSWPVGKMSDDFKPFRLALEEVHPFLDDTQHITVWKTV